MRKSAKSGCLAMGVCVVLAFAGAADAAGIAAEVRLKPRANVEGPVITLGDVADIVHSDAKLQSRMERIRIGPAPRAGQTVRVDFSSIRSHLRDYGFDLTHIRFAGASVISVTSGTPAGGVQRAGYRRRRGKRSSASRRAHDAVAKAIQRYLQNHVPELGMVTARVRIADNDLPKLLSAVDSGYYVRGGRPPWDRPQVFSVRFLDRNEQIHEVVVEAGIEKLPYILAAKFGITKGEMIRASDLVWKQVDRIKDGDVTSYRDAVGLEATRTIRADESIGKSNARRVPLIRSNELITVYAGRPGIRVARQMKSRGTGASGDTIQAVSLDGRTRILVRVVAPREAEVISAGPARSAQYADRTGSIQFVESRPAPRRRRDTTRRSPIRRVSGERDRDLRR